MSDIERTINSELIFNGKVIKVYVDDILIDNVNVASKREVVVHNGGACALIKTKNEKIIFVKQYRYACKTETIELPAGKIDIGESPDMTIIREVGEEVGIIPVSIEKKGFIYTSPGFCTEKIYLYYIEDYSKTNTHFDFDESLDYFEYSYEEAIDLMNEGKLNDSKSIALLLKCRDKFINK